MEEREIGTRLHCAKEKEEDAAEVTAANDEVE